MQKAYDTIKKKKKNVQIDENIVKWKRGNSKNGKQWIYGREKRA